MVVTTTGFSGLARHTGRSNGIENLAVAEYPGPLGMHDEARIARLIEETLADAVAAGLTGAAASTGAAVSAHDPYQPVFAGDAEEVSRHYLGMQWSDGLPIVPPTPDRVARYVARSGRSADETVAILPSANLRATPWNIAVNAVMAGCAPEHMPLLVAAVEALGDERCALGSIGSSSGIFPFVLINGPVVDALGVEFGAQLVSRGPNPAIGRAIGLFVRNLAGFRPGTSYMGTFGYPLAFALAEHASTTPWEPFHVEHGFGADESTVTLGVTNNWGSTPAPYETPESSGARTALDLICRETVRKTRVYHFPDRGPDGEHVMLTVLLSPPVARSLAEAGYDKQAVKRYVAENACMPLREFEWVLRQTNIHPTTVRERIDAGVYPPDFARGPDDPLRVLAGPELVHVVVCGDPHRNRLMVLEGGHTRPTLRRIAAGGCDAPHA